MDIGQLVQGIKRYELLSKQKLFERLKAQDKGVSRKAYDEWWGKNKNPVQELYAKPQKKFKFARITGPPYSYQIDTIRMDRYKRQNSGRTRFLLLVEIGSRKAFAYVLKSENVTDVLTAYKRFLKDADHQPFFVQGDDYFSAKAFVAFNRKRDIPVTTVVAADEHVTVGNPLGILDRCVQTLRSMIEKRIHAHDDPKWTRWLDEVIEDYNSNPHRSLKGRTPDDVYDDLAALQYRWEQDSAYNRTVGKQVTEAFQPGDYVRMKLQKTAFEKGATQTMSLEVYQVVKVSGSRVQLKTYPAGEKVARAAKANELLKVDQPVLMSAPAAMVKAKKQARQARKLVAEGLPEPEPDKEPAGDTVADAVEKGKLVVLDAEGQAEDPHAFTVQDGAKKGYVFAGVVSKVTKAKVYIKLYQGAPGGSLSQKRITAGSKSVPIDAKAHKDAVLYVGDAPRVRSDGSTSIPKSVVDIVKREYVFAAEVAPQQQPVLRRSVPAAQQQEPVLRRSQRTRK